MLIDDELASIDKRLPISEKLNAIHKEIKRHAPFVDRIAIAIYDEESDLLKTFIASSDNPSTLRYYQSPLKQSASLVELVDSGKSRVINDLSVFSEVDKQHRKSIDKEGYTSSYTCPIYNNEVFTGFIFINSREKNVFTPSVLSELSPFAHLISLITAKELDLVNVLLGSVCTALDISHHRDPETGAHLERMSRYSRLIALELAPTHQLDDEYIEYLYRFAPLHDVGKIAIPDNILLKPGRLTDEEFEIMKSHSSKGRDMIDRMLNNFKLTEMKHTDMLRNIIEHHHETLDGQGYPNQLQAENIPLEARITTVADIFDALTSQRPYKKAWSNDEAFAELTSMTQSKLDKVCVDALIKRRVDVEQIQKQFEDDYFG
ncbi:MAG: HD domain-containing protein [Chromatiales bacterium]|nr:HD domain-containing protein [Chromatiales bacterium]